jgi:cobalt-zinc-cadmium efflux system membrane fusion protein
MKTKLILFVGFLLMTGCDRRNSSEEHEKKNTAEAGIATVTEKNKPQEVKNNDAVRIKMMGYIDVPPQNIYRMSVAVGGILKYTKLLPGMKFKKGEILAVMEHPEYLQIQTDYLKAKALNELSEKNFVRQKELYENKAISEKEFEIIRADYVKNKAEYQQLRKKLELLYLNPDQLDAGNMSPQIRIPAPFDGFVTELSATVGKYISPGEAMFEFVDPSDIHLNIKVPENLLHNVSIGNIVECYSPFNPEKKFKCEIILINKKLNNDKTIDVHCHFLKYDEELIPGMLMEVLL